jgi:hypothetical protein
MQPDDVRATEQTLRTGTMLDRLVGDLRAAIELSDEG